MIFERVQIMLGQQSRAFQPSSISMGSTRTLEFVPYAQARVLALGQDARSVVMTARSPSPPAYGATQRPITSAPRRITPKLIPAPSSPVASSSSANTVAPSPAVSAPNTPSRKGKERQVATPNGTPGVTPNGKTPNGAVNGSAGGLPNGSAKSSPKKEARSPKVPKLDAKNVLYTGDIGLAWPDKFAIARRPAGLVNNAMACYSNATLQVLLHTPPVLQMVLEHGNCGFCR